ncbi:MAG: glycosyltransferase family 4 protein [Planctomycetes bacterium]|nr:glycosyltransferase family 4 protein [Planctomycetota bacterium]MBI3846148.1 glycosyltransferase family 4 protein [Planctomycetota bacterium]
MSAVRIGIDAHAIGSRLGGNETYVRGLLNGLRAIETSRPFDVFHLRSRGAEAVLTSLPPNFRTHALSPENPLVRIPWVFPRALRRAGCGVVHVQYIAPPRSPCPIVASIHDVAFVRHPEFFTRWERLYLSRLVPRTAARAAAILTLSEHSKKELIDVYRIPEEKITVTALAPAACFRPLDRAECARYAKERFGVDEPFLLFVGNLQPRKNLQGLLEAFEILRTKKKVEHRLVVVGKKTALSGEALARANDSKIRDAITFTGWISDEDLARLYNAADLFVFPSYYEGFGLPIVEAMACGTPVLTSQRPPMAEVSGGAAALVEPSFHDQIAESILVLLRDPFLRPRLAKAGLARAATFSWERTARETLAVYRSVIEEGGST